MLKKKIKENLNFFRQKLSGKMFLSYLWLKITEKNFRKIFLALKIGFYSYDLIDFLAK